MKPKYTEIFNTGDEPGSAPIITCALPLYRSGKIAWLALESLCRQRSIDFSWELIVCEEVRQRGVPLSETNPLTLEGLSEYSERLKAVGCSRVLYIPLTSWIPLSDKWVKMAGFCSESSYGFLLVAGDCYSYPKRLINSKKMFDCGGEWVQAPVGSFYNILSGTLSVFDHKLSKESSIPGHRVHPCALNMGIKTSIIKKIESGGKERSVDSWMFMQAQTILGRPPKINMDLSGDWMEGVDTHGYNQISRLRGGMIGSESRDPEKPFRKPTCREPDSIREILPESITRRLLSLPRDIPEPEPLGQDLLRRSHAKRRNRLM